MPTVRRSRTWLTLAAAAVGALIFGVFCRSEFLTWGLPRGLATGGALAMGLSFIGATGLYAGTFMQLRLQRPVELVLCAALYAVPTAVVVAAVARGLVHLPLPLAVALGGIAAAVQFRVTYRREGALLGDRMKAPVYADDESERARIERLTRGRLDDPGLTPRERALLTVNRIRALTEAAAVEGGELQLAEAFRLAVPLARSSELEWHLRFRAVWDLVGAWDVHAQAFGSADGYAQSLDLMRRVAGQAPPEHEALARRDLASAVAQHGSWQLTRLDPDDEGSGALRRRIVGECLAQLTAALRHEREGSEWYVDLLAQYGMFLGVLDPARARAELEPALARLKVPSRKAARHIRGAWAQLAAGVARALHEVVVEGASDDPERDLAEAERLMALVLRVAPEFASTANAQLAELRELRRTLDTAPDAWGADPCRPRRDAYLAARGQSLLSATTRAADWAQCAAAHDRAGEAADAYLAVLAELPGELERRYSLDAAREFARRMQGTAAEAGYWLLAEGRTGEAVAAIETARAVLLEQRTRRLPAGLTENLARRGRQMLAEQLTRAAAALEEFDRSEFRRARRAGDRLAPGRGLEIYTAYRRLRREADQALGLDPAQGEALLDAVRSLAREFPVVYAFSAERGGGLLVVRRDGTIEGSLLPELTAAAVGELTETLNALVEGSARPAERAGLLARLRSLVGDPLSSLVGPEGVATVVPVGGLSLLPLHAAVPDAGPVLAYAPSARTLARGAGPRPSAGPPVRRLAVIGATADLEYAADEVREVARLYSRRLEVEVCEDEPGDVVRRALHAASVWHLACHAEGRPLNPLDNCIALSRQPLTLGELLADPPRHAALAVLSACETAVPGRHELDEALTFPAALLAYGVRTVVATGWPVASEAAYLFSVRLHELLLRGTDPALAAASAAAWLRQGTNRAFRQYTRGAYGPRQAVNASPAVLELWLDDVPFSDPYYWASFAVHGR
jgi:hypothetical protein